MLMWSYYTNNHEGFCIEYDTNKHCIFKDLVLPVIYKEERYNAARLLETRSENIIINPVVYKAKCWEHEKEWRVFLNKNNPYYMSDSFCLKDAISGVYLGARMREDISNEIETWGAKENVPIYKMKLHNKYYKIVY